MDNKTYNVCLRIARLSCANVASELAGVNGLKDASCIQMKVKDKDRLMNAVFNIIRGVKPASCQADVKASLSITSSVKLRHSINGAMVFVQSVSRCGDARVCQKRLMDMGAAERYLRMAYDWDVTNRDNKAMREARKAIAGIHSERFLQDFTPYGRPQVDPNVKAALERRAFDERYSFTSRQTVADMAARRFQSVYAKRGDFFVQRPDARPVMPHESVLLDCGHTGQAQRLMPVSLKQEDPVMDMGLLRQLYNGEFADLPMKGKRRRFVNLAVRCRDLMDCPKRMLHTKKRFLEIESMTKHSYIYGYYDDGVRGTMTPESVANYYMQKEAEMYQQIWHTDQVVYFDGRNVTFPDGTVLQVPAGENPYLFMHRVNVIYAAMFGFTPDDMLGGGKWLEDSVRCAYTDEGMADYRLAIVAARLSGQMR